MRDSRQREGREACERKRAALFRHFASVDEPSDDMRGFEIDDMWSQRRPANCKQPPLYGFRSGTTQKHLNQRASMMIKSRHAKRV